MAVEPTNPTDPPCVGVCMIDPASGVCLGCGKAPADIPALPDAQNALPIGAPDAGGNGREATAETARQAFAGSK